MRTITFPTPTINAITWGGRNNDILFVTSEQYTYNMTYGGLSNTVNPPPAGAIFMVEGVGATGVPARKYCLDCCKRKNCPKCSHKKRKICTKKLQKTSQNMNALN